MEEASPRQTRLWTSPAAHCPQGASILKAVEKSMDGVRGSWESPRTSFSASRRQAEGTGLRVSLDQAQRRDAEEGN